MTCPLLGAAMIMVAGGTLGGGCGLSTRNSGCICDSSPVGVDGRDAVVYCGRGGSMSLGGREEGLDNESERGNGPSRPKAGDCDRLPGIGSSLLEGTFLMVSRVCESTLEVSQLSNPSALFASVGCC